MWSKCRLKISPNADGDKNESAMTTLSARGTGKFFFFSTAGRLRRLRATGRASESYIPLAIATGVPPIEGGRCLFFSFE